MVDRLERRKGREEHQLLNRARRAANDAAPRFA
jgi:hypothetical protein